MGSVDVKPPNRASQEVLLKLHSNIGLRPSGGGLGYVRARLRDAYRVNRNVRLALDACLSCGRCLEVCQAYMATGDPFNSPLGRITLAKMLLRGLSVRLDDLYKYFWACITCRRCAWACPLGIDVADLTRVMRGILYEAGLASRYVSNIVMNLESTGNFLGVTPDVLKVLLSRVVEEIKEEKGVEVKVKVDESAYALMLLSSCAEFTIALDSLKGYLLFLNEVGLDFTLSSRTLDSVNYGLFLHEGHMRLIADRVVDEAERLGVRLVIVGECGHGWRVFKNYILPRLRERNIEGVHIFHLVLDALRRGIVKLNPGAIGRLTYVYQDPCHYVRGGDLVDEPRQILRLMGVEFKDGSADGRALCCGGSGGLLADELAELSVRYAEPLYRNVIRLGGECIIMPCASCKLQLNRALPILNSKYNRNISYTGIMEILYKALEPVRLKSRQTQVGGVKAL